MKYNPLSRRMFLQGAGNTMLAMPLLPSLLPREAWAQAAAVNKRFITISGQLDVGHNANWIPSLTPAVFRSIPQPATVDPRGFRWQALRDFAPNSSTPLARLYGTSLNNYLRSVNIMRGLDIGGYYGHGMAPRLGSYKKGDVHNGDSLGVRPASIDYLLSQNARINPSRRSPTTIGQRFGEGDGFTVNDAVGGSSGLGFTDDFGNLYRNLFTGVTESGGGTTTTTTPAHPRRDLLNRVMEDYTRTRSHRNISTVDRQVLTNVMDRFADIHRRLPTGTSTTVTAAGCSHLGLRTASGHISPNTYLSTLGVAEDSVKSRLLVDILTAAIMCNVNNIFTMFFDVPFRGGVDNRSGFFARSEVTPLDTTSDYHQRVSHDPWALTRTGEYRWQWAANHQGLIIQNILAPLMAALDAAVDPANNQTFLYNSVIFTTFEHGTTHSENSVPTILAGNGGGALSSGNYIDYSDRSYTPRLDQYRDGGAYDPNSERFSGNYQGVSYNRFLVTILQAMGMQPSEYENRSLNQRWYNRTDLGTRNANLTGIGGYGYFAPNVEQNDQRAALAGVDLRQFGSVLPLP